MLFSNGECMRKFCVLVTCVALMALAGCAKDISPQTYEVGSVGQAASATPATVVSWRYVHVAGTESVGTTVGAVAGGAAGSAIGGNTRVNIIGAVGGALIGGLAGGAIEGGLTSQKGIEYVIEVQNGGLKTIVQGPGPQFAVGQRVLLLQGNPARLIADTRWEN